MAGKLTAIALLLCIPLVASAAIIPVAGDGADQQISASGSSWVGQGDIRVGMGSTEGSCAVLVFELPLLPAGETIGSADLAFSVVGGNNWNVLGEKGMDLYAVRMDPAAAAALTDYYKGSYGGDASATGIEPYVVYEPLVLNQGLPGEMGRHDTSAAGEAALGVWLQSMYDSPAYDPAGANFVYLRLGAREDLTSTYRYWSVASANNAVEADRPLLTITTVPEPATLSLLAAGALALIRRRK